MQHSDGWFTSHDRGIGKDCRLFCLPFAGGTAAAYRTWGDALGPRVEVLPMELPGHGTRMREAAYTRLELLAVSAAAAMRPLLDRPFAVFGHSMGALLGFEILRALRRQGGPPPLALFASAHRAPHVPDPLPPLRDLPREQLVAALRRLGGTPAGVLDCRELMDLLLPTLRADFEVTETYVCQDEAPLDCPIVALASLQDLRAPHPEVAAWEAHTRGAFRLRLFPGDHFFIQPGRAAVLRGIAEDLQLLWKKESHSI